MRDVDRRATAAILALALSGLPQIAAGLAVERTHRCECATHGDRHVCACKVCRARARAISRARPSETARVAAPPCHGGSADALRAEAGTPDGSGAPCLEPTCGRDDDVRSGSSLLDAFVVPRALRLERTDVTARLRADGETSLDRTDAPRPPPPRSE